MKTVLGIALASLILAGSPLFIGGQSVAKPPVVRSKPQSEGKSKASAAVDADESSSKGDKLGPIGVFADIEKGWKSENVNLITQHFGNKKVAISIDGIGPVGGSFSRSQSHYLFKDLFEYTITERFEFVQYRNVTDGKVEVYAVAERSYKRNDDGRLFKDKIYVSLQQEDNRWVISEIKSVR
jgi:hypothetical protein